MTLKSHLRYLSYVLRHKWYVFWAGWKLAPDFWSLLVILPQLIVHDWTKFMPWEWIPYTRFFYGGFQPPQAAADFKVAWNHHQKLNAHHWQYWVLVNDSDEPKISALDMPERYIREMVADWVGAGLAITGRIEVADWYRKNYDNIILSERTRDRVDFLVNFAQGYLEEYSSDYFTKKSTPLFVSAVDAAGNFVPRYPARRECVPAAEADSTALGSGETAQG
jgi:hypothetical protein